MSAEAARGRTRHTEAAGSGVWSRSGSLFRWPTRDRWLALVLIILQVVLLAWLSTARVFPGCIVCVAAWGVLGRWRLKLDRVHRQLVVMSLAILFLLQHLIWPFPIPPDAQFINSPLAHAVARFLLVTQVLQLFLEHPEGRLPVWLAGLGAATLPFAANLQVDASVQESLVWLFAAFVGAAAMYGSQARRPVESSSGAGGGWNRARRSLLGVLLLTVMVGGSAAALFLQRYERKIELFLTDFLGSERTAASAGFSPDGRLADVLEWRSLGADRIALRVFSDREPGYLRGKVFDVYSEPAWDRSWATWSTQQGPKPIGTTPAPRDLPRIRSEDPVYRVSRGGAAARVYRVLDVWPAAPGGQAFTTDDTAYLAGRSVGLSRDRHGMIVFADRSHQLPYTVYAHEGILVEPLPEPLRADLLRLDAEIAPGVVSLAESLCENCRTPTEKIARVESFFREQFQYRLGIDVPRGEDPITHFLLRRQPAHCEFFATGTAVLLRLAGVPCRYVIGYVVRERNAVGGYWVARNRNAHAWVEAYDEQRGGWVRVESTPAAGIPTPQEDRLVTRLADSLQHYWTMFRLRLRENGLGGLASMLLATAWSIPGLVVMLVMTLSFLIRRQPPRARRERRLPDPRLRAMHAALARLDQTVRRRGLERGPEETLARFARRVRRTAGDDVWSTAVADCYLLYAELRYQGQTDPRAVDTFRTMVAGIPPRRAPVGTADASP
jgi:transglutaminase-like putative cysteine protease